MKKTLTAVAALSFVFGSSVALAQPAAQAEATPVAKTAKPAAKHHHKHKAKAAAAK